MLGLSALGGGTIWHGQVLVSIAMSDSQYL